MRLNLRQLGTAGLMYAGDNRDCWPMCSRAAGGDWWTMWYLNAAFIENYTGKSLDRYPSAPPGPEEDYIDFPGAGLLQGRHSAGYRSPTGSSAPNGSAFAMA